jgi:hypothetical protein
MSVKVEIYYFPVVGVVHQSLMMFQTAHSRGGLFTFSLMKK